MVACNQPFDEVENPKFISLMEYGHDLKTFSLPKKDGVCRQVMKLGEETIQETKDMFVVSFLFIIILQYLGHFFLYRNWKAKLASHLKNELQVITTPSWQLLHTT